MSDTSPFGFGKLVPGFDFLQSLVKGASTSIPQMPQLSNWVAPTISVEELEKRIGELKAVQFWLEQNSRALTATIQALEVQKMTLATLKGMNFSMGDVASAFQTQATGTVMDTVHKAADTFTGAAARRASSPPESAPEAAPKPWGMPQGEPSRSAASAAAQPDGDRADGDGGAQNQAGQAKVVDPLQWWGALTSQFQQIAAGALNDVSAQAASANAPENAADLAKDAFKKATDMATQLAAQSLQSFQHMTPAAPPRARRAKEAAAAPAPAKKAASRSRAAPSKSAGRTTAARAGKATPSQAKQANQTARAPRKTPR